MAGTYKITGDTNGLFVGFFQTLTNEINLSSQQGITMELTSPGGVSANNNVASPPLSEGAPLSQVTVQKQIVAGTAQQPVAKPTITVSSDGGTNNKFAITGDTGGFWNAYFLALTAFINSFYANGITMELSAPMVYPGAPIVNFNRWKYFVNGTAFPAPSAPTITVS